MAFIEENDTASHLGSGIRPYLLICSDNQVSPDVLVSGCEVISHHYQH